MKKGPDCSGPFGLLEKQSPQKYDYYDKSDPVNNLFHTSLLCKNILEGLVAPFTNEILFSAIPKCSANNARTASLARPSCAGALTHTSNVSGAFCCSRVFFSPACTFTFRYCSIPLLYINHTTLQAISPPQLRRAVA